MSKIKEHISFADRFLIFNLVFTLVLLFLQSFQAGFIILLVLPVSIWCAIISPMVFFLFGFIKILTYRKQWLGVLMGTGWMLLGLLVIWLSLLSFGRLLFFE